ncbi:MAG: hypothetical protein JO302_01930 [Candidatus Eremiobacteraeota bacterium]|nr:hypothetical protein [Candidatus Eremiobacteraeota bacterium]
MKSALPAFLLAAALALPACGSHRTTTQTSDANATVTTSQDNKSVTVQTKQGTMSIGANADTSKLGAPVYPGAQINEQGAVTTTSAKGTDTMAGFKTADPFDKVESYYKHSLPAGSEIINLGSGNGSVATFQLHLDNGSTLVTVNVTQSKPGETDILITRVAKGS